MTGVGSMLVLGFVAGVAGVVSYVGLSAIVRRVFGRSFSATEAMDMNVAMSVMVDEALEMLDEDEYPDLQYRVNEKLQEFFDEDAWIVIKDGEIHVPDEHDVQYER